MVDYVLEVTVSSHCIFTDEMNGVEDEFREIFELGWRHMDASEYDIPCLKIEHIARLEEVVKEE